MTRTHRDHSPKTKHGRAHVRRKTAGLVVGLGASAGGLEPLQQFFARVPPNTGLTFVVVQHLDPRQPSLLVNLLSRHASMPVLEAVDGMRAEVDHVYVAPPGTVLTLEKTVWRTPRPAGPAAGGSIDALFRSLAVAAGERAVGIVLSGSGQDGTLGLRAIKEREGLTLAQSPETAAFDSMPRSAIEAGLVDRVLPPDGLAAAVLEHAGYVGAHDGAPAAERRLGDALASICSLVQQRTGHDFASYKTATLLRRIRRRMQIVRASGADDYVAVLQQGDAEAWCLVKDLLIGVTQFFRDPEAFETLAREALPRLIEARPPDLPVRIWVPGCASGEEAYSIAMLVREQLERLGSERSVQIFGTDLDAEKLAKARAGRYPRDIGDDVGPERLARFFTRARTGEYQLVKPLRETCVFSQHSLVRDPPFSQLDLISCRNVLIYFSAELQKKVVPLLHYALRPGGFLFLGPSEGIAGDPELFETVDKSSRIFRRKETLTRRLADFPLIAGSRVNPVRVPSPTRDSEQTPATLRQQVSAAFERTILEEYAEPCAVVNDRGDLVLVAGRFDRYFRFPAGAVTTNLLDLVPARLRVELRAALRSAAARQRAVVRQHVAVGLEDGVHRVRLTVRPVPGLEPAAGLLLVAVQDHAPFDPAEEGEEGAEMAEQAALDRLESELHATRADLKTALEDYESANEELKSSNEELISTNEELQSANEELQTSQGELQSLNEELQTVNAELRQKVDEIAAANSDLQRAEQALRDSEQRFRLLIDGVKDYTIVMLLPDGAVASWNPGAERLKGYRADEIIGRHFSRFFTDEDVSAGKPQRELEVAAGTGRFEEEGWRVRKDGSRFWANVVVTAVLDETGALRGFAKVVRDITERKRSEDAVETHRQLLETVVNHIPASVNLIRGTDLRIQIANPAYRAIAPGKEMIGKTLDEVWPETGRQFGELCRRVLETGQPFHVDDELNTIRRTPDGPLEEAYFSWSLDRVLLPGNDGWGILNTAWETTERRRAERALHDSEARFRTMANTIPQLAWMARADGFIYWYNDRWYEYTGTTPQQMEGWGWRSVHEPDVLPTVLERWQDSIASGSPFDMVFPLRGADGRFRPFLTRVRPLKDSEGTVTHWFGTNTDVSEIEEVREALRDNEQRLRLATEAARIGTFDWDLQSGVNVWSPELEAMYGLAPGQFARTQPAWEQLVHPDDRAAAIGKVEEALATGEPVEGEWRVVWSDGSVRWLSGRFQAFKNAAGRPLRLTGVNLDITERKEAEEALRKSEERFRVAQELSPDGFLIFRPLRDDSGLVTDFVWLYENDAAARMNDTDPKEVRGKKVSDVLPHHHQSRFHTVYKEVAETGEVRVVEESFYDQDTFRERRWFRVVAVPSGGDVAVLVQNVTGRKETEEALRRSEARWNAAIETFGVGAIIATEDEQVVYWNPAARAMHGFTRPDEGIEPLEKTPITFQLWTLDGRHLLELEEWPMRRIKRGELVRDLELRLRRPDQGWERIVSYSGAMVETQGGERLIFLTVHDLTEQRRAEQALLRSREGLRGLAEASLSVMAKTDLGEMLQAISEAALALTGARLATCGHGFVSGQSIVGGSARMPGEPACPPGEMFLPDKGGVHMQLIEGAASIRLTDAELRAHPTWWGLPHGHVPMRGLLGARMLARNGKTNGMILVTNKEHGEFGVDDEVLLQQLATVASLALQHVETRIALEEADRRKDHFLAMLSHELRNPIAPIRYALHILEHAKPGGEQALRGQSVIGRQVGHLTRLVDDLLDVTRISRGKIQLQRERLELCELVRRTVEDYRDAFAKNQLVLELLLPDDALHVNADRTRIAQVIGNLLSNAAKFTPPGGTSTVSLERNRDLGQAVLTVRDTGVGIAPEMLARVFEPFAQADSTLDRSKGGLGLGLAMVKGLVEMHGGTASVESGGAGKGARFTICLPLEDGGDVPRVPAEHGRTREDGGRRVLVIEDNVDSAETLRELLEMNGHTVALAFSGLEGIEKAREFGPEVVLCDIGLPGMDGYEVARTIRGDAALRGVRLAALTGYAGTEDIARARNAGFDAHVAKPPSPESLAELLSRTQNDPEV